MKIVLIGIQGSGKSTQGNLLSKELKIPYLSTGHIFRQIAKEKTKLGHQVKVLMTSGMLIPDELTIDIVNNYLSRKEYERGYILDGFPRTLEQAKKYINNVDKVIYLEIPDKEALWRIAYRKEMRNDNTVQAVAKRIEIFHNHTKPVLEYYENEGKLTKLDGTLPIEEVNKEILKSLGKQLIKNHIKAWEQRKKTIIAIVGMSGSGKTEAAGYFKQIGLPVVSFSNIINDYIDEHKLKHTEDVHNRLRKEFREKYGMKAMAYLSKDKLEEALKENNIVVIEGLYSWEEYIFIKEQFEHVRVYLVAIYADKELRYKRISERGYRSKLYGEERDINELISTNKGPPIAFADFLVKNNFSLEDLHDKLEEVYRTIYFS